MLEARRLVAKHQEDVVRVQDELKRAITVSAKGGGSATGRELELQKDNEKLMVSSFGCLVGFVCLLYSCRQS